MISQVLRTLYGSLWKAAIPVLQRHKRLKIGFDQRLVPPSWPGKFFPASSSPLFWIQAASGGEATLIFPLIEALSDGYAKTHSHSMPPRFLCTTCTEQGMEIIQKGFSLLPQQLQENCAAAYFPLDSPTIMQRAIQQARPSMVLLLETELWPGLLHELKKAKIPYTIVNARMTAKTSRTYKKVRSFFTSHRPCLISATTAENASRFNEVFGMSQTAESADLTGPTGSTATARTIKTTEPVKIATAVKVTAVPKPVDTVTDGEIVITPNIKFDIIHQQLGEPNNHPPAGYEALYRYLSFVLPSRTPPPPAQAPVLPPCIALASVREEEEEAVGTIVQKICQHNVQGIPALCLLAPRHLHRLQYWGDFLEKSGIPFVLKSQIEVNLPTLSQGSCATDHWTKQNNSVSPTAHTSFIANTLNTPAAKQGQPTPQITSPRSAPEDLKCILWDTFGELNLLYALADTAFVGGSLAPLGGQNFLEPLAQGTPTIIGPSWSNFSWVGDELFTQKILLKESSPDAVAKRLLDNVNNQLAYPFSEWPGKRALLKKEVKNKLSAAIFANAGGSKLTAERILSFFPKRNDFM